MQIDEKTFRQLPEHLQSLFVKLPNPGSDEVLAAFAAFGERGAAAPVLGNEPSAAIKSVYQARDRVPGAFHADTGTAARFFYTAKASREEREIGLRMMPESARRMFASGGRTQVDGEWVETNSEPLPRSNVHPTVKPLALMQWLCRLVTPKGGTILDPFCGSGSTLVAADREGFHAIGIERELEYLEIARRRFTGDCPLFADLVA